MDSENNIYLFSSNTIIYETGPKGKFDVLSSQNAHLKFFKYLHQSVCLIYSALE